MTDSLDTLPVDELPVRPQDQPYLNVLIQQKKKSTVQSFFQDLKKPIVLGILFMVISTPTFHRFIQSMIPYTQKSDLSVLMAKTVLFIGMVYLLGQRI